MKNKISCKNCGWYITGVRPKSDTFEGDLVCPDCLQPYTASGSVVEEDNG